MEKRIQSLDEFINENKKINEGVYDESYTQATLKDLKFVASNYVKDPKVIYGIPTKNFGLQLNVEKMGTKCNLSTPYTYDYLHKGTGQYRLWAGRPVIVMYDDINKDYFFYSAKDNFIVGDANTLRVKLSDLLKNLKDQKELNSEGDYQSVLGPMTSWNNSMIKK